MTIAATAALLAAQITRLSFASDLAGRDAGRAFDLAPAIPDALSGLAMAEIGMAAAVGASPTDITMRRLQSLSAVSPLRTEPYLVKAALAVRANDLSEAEALLIRARSLDPRSAAARYLLADVWLRQNQVARALGEMAALTRIMPGITLQLVPSLAQYARSPGAEQQLRTILRANPNLRNPLLAALSADPDNAELVITLAGPELRSTDPAALAWKSRLVKGLVSQGTYREARQLWTAFVGPPAGRQDLVFNGEFRKLDTPEPFGWIYRSGAAGLAEPQNGSLRVLYYGRDNTTLATQLLLLTPGEYTFTSPVNGTAQPAALEWIISCGAAGKHLMELDITAKPPADRFTVSAGCPSQRLELVGVGTDSPKESDVQLGPIQITRIGA